MLKINIFEQFKILTMKKIILSLAIVFATSTVLVSCGGKKDEGSANATTEAITEDATETEEVSTETASENEESTMDKVKEKASEIKDKASEKIEEGKEVAKPVVDKIKGKIK